MKIKKADMNAEEFLKDKNIVSIIGGVKANLTVTQGLIDLLEAYHQSKIESQWISVDDELPKENGFFNVKINTDEGDIIHSCWFDLDLKKWCYDNFLAIGEPLYSMSWFANVTHWQPLPKEPK
ncbi:MAG: DUF551 domain-containing protein [bacterium]|nr:DUF551 domain-containing protein [bacterium]